MNMHSLQQDSTHAGPELGGGVGAQLLGGIHHHDHVQDDIMRPLSPVISPLPVQGGRGR